MTDRKKLSDEDLDTILAIARNEQSGRITPCEVETLVAAYRDLDRPVGGVVAHVFVDEEGNTLVPEDQAAAIKQAFENAPVSAPFGKPLRKALRFYLAPSPAIGRETDLLAEISERNMEEKRAEWAATALSSAQERIAELEGALAERDDLLMKATRFRFADDLFVESRGPSAWGVTDGVSWSIGSTPRMSFSEAVTFAREILARRSRTTEKMDG